jgi:hypothetical protein
MGHDPIDPVIQDNKTMWQHENRTPSKAFRNLAIIEDVKALKEPGVVLALLPGWNQYPEAKAMVAVAEAMGQEVKELDEGIFREPECQEY